MGLNINLFTVSAGSSEAAGSMAGAAAGVVACPNCGCEPKPAEERAGSRRCPRCEKRLEFRAWTAARQSTNAVVAMPGQATCFFHPDKAFQACCQRCGRFVCALCDLQLGAEHVCPTCFERGRTSSRLDGKEAEWRHRDVLYDSIAITLGWCWILIWPLLFAALPIAIFLHVKYRKAPQSYLIPRSGWRFWVAYAGFMWLPLLIASTILIPRWFAGRQ